MIASVSAGHATSVAPAPPTTSGRGRRSRGAPRSKVGRQGAEAEHGAGRDGERLNVLERLAAFTAAFTSRGFDPVVAHDKALKLLDGSVSIQAAVMSFGDTFWVAVPLVLATLPLVLLLGKGGSAEVSAGH